jgi:hypothetical protein
VPSVMSSTPNGAHGCGGWSPDHYENWLSDSLTLLLLPPTTGTAGPSK